MDVIDEFPILDDVLTILESPINSTILQSPKVQATSSDTDV